MSFLGSWKDFLLEVLTERNHCTELSDALTVKLFCRSYGTYFLTYCCDPFLQCRQSFRVSKGCSMKWQGQMNSEHIMQYTLLAPALIAFLTGFLMSSYRIMLTIYLIGAGITLLVTVTDWDYFNRNPLEWWEPRYVDIPSTRELRLQQKQHPHQQFIFVNPYCKRS